MSGKVWYDESGKKYTQEEADNLNRNELVALDNYIADSYKQEGNLSGLTYEEYYDKVYGTPNSAGMWDYSTGHVNAQGIQTLIDKGYLYNGGTLTSYDPTKTGTSPQGNVVSDSSGIGGTSNSAPVSYNSFSSYLDTKTNYLAQQRNASYASAEATRKEAERLAEIERKRASVNADTMHQQNKATYGGNAEALGGMGLTGSGYSDYLNSQAYAAGMAAKQSANAQAAETKRQALYAEEIARREADANYFGGLEQRKLLEEQKAAQAESEYKTNYGKLFELAASGYGAEEIGALADVYGMNAKDKEALTATATKYSSMFDTEETTPTAAEGGYTTITSIEDAFHNTDIDDTTRKNYITELNNSAKAKVQTYIADNNIVGANTKADELYAADEMDKETYQSIKAELASKNVAGVENVEDVNAVVKDLEKMLKTEQITEETYNELTSKTQDTAKNIINYGNVDMSGIKVEKGDTTDSYVRNITIGEEVYTVKMITIPSQMKSILSNEQPNKTTITEYDGEYYMYDAYKKKWFVITPYIDPNNPRVTINHAVYDALKTKVKK